MLASSYKIRKISAFSIKYWPEELSYYLIVAQAKGF